MGGLARRRTDLIRYDVPVGRHLADAASLDRLADHGFLDRILDREGFDSEAPEALPRPITDALIAAAATARGVGVLHYDEQFDRLATVLGFDSRWIVPGGSA